MRTREIIPVVLLLASGASCPLAAQEIALDYIQRTNGWLTSYNAAGLHHLSARKASVAEVYTSRGNGHLVNYHESPNRLSWGARTASLFRLDDNVVVHGKIEYHNSHGKNSGGAAFIDPAFAPFNILEQADTNRGTKSSERYSLAGAVSTRLYRDLRAGGRIEYTTMNLAKHKDLRHKNTLLDMTVTAGLALPVTRHIEAGVNYYYRRAIEGIVFNVYGNTDRQYFSIIDFGAFFGRRELFGESGYTSEDQPLFSAFQGAALQLHVTRPRWSLFNEITYKARSGYFGERSSTSVRYSDHEGTAIEYRGLLSHATTGGTLHLIDARASRETLANHENIYRYETTQGGSTLVVYYGQAKMLDRVDTRASLAYTGQRGLVAGRPAREWHAGADYYQRSITASIYPFYREQRLHAYSARLSAACHQPLRRASGDAIGLSLALAYSAGGGDPRNDGVYATPSADQSAPKSVDHLLYREHEYLTLPRGEASLSATYLHPLVTGVIAHASIDATFRRAFDSPRFLTGSTARTLTLRLGCLF
jgi:opacity protein-like surface antigen